MWPDQVSNPEPLTNKSGSLLTALRGPAKLTPTEHGGRNIRVASPVSMPIHLNSVY